MSATPNPATWRSGVLYCGSRDSSRSRIAVAKTQKLTIGKAGVFAASPMTTPSCTAKMTRKTPNRRLLRNLSIGSGRDLIEVQRGSCGEHEAVCGAVDQARTTEATDRVERVITVYLVGFAVAHDLLDTPRMLIVLVEEPDQDTPIMHVLVLYGWVRLLLHRKVPPFGATAPGQFALSLGPISRMQPKLDSRSYERKGFRQGFRQRLLGLREPQLHVELTTLKPLQEEIYGALRTRMARAVRSGGRDQATVAQMGSVTMYLLQAASNPALLAGALGAPGPSSVQWPLDLIPEDSNLADLIREYARHETPAKFDKLATMVAANAAQGRKTLVWTNFVGNLTELKERVLAPYEPAMIRGDVPAHTRLPGQLTRQDELRRFRRDERCMVLVANPAAMSEGVSLHQDCHDAIYVDRTFNAGQYLQSLDRIHRLGLAENVETQMTFLAGTGTLDEIIDRRLRVKAERLSIMLEDEDLVTMALPDEEEGYSEVIETDDLEELFGHLRDDASFLETAGRAAGSRRPLSFPWLAW